MLQRTQGRRHYNSFIYRQSWNMYNVQFNMCIVHFFSFICRKAASAHENWQSKIVGGQGVQRFESRHPLHPSCCFREAEVDWMGRWGTDQVHTGKHASQPASSLSIARAVEKGLQASLRNSLTNCLGFLNSGLNNSFHIQDIQPRFFYYYITSGAIHKWRL